MKILIHNDFLVAGGVEIVLCDLVHYLIQQGHTITVSSSHGTAKQAEALFSKSIRYYTTTYRMSDDKRFSRKWFVDRGKYLLHCVKIRCELRKKYDVAIAIKEGGPMKWISSMNAKKKYAWIHTDYSFFHGPKYDFDCAEDELECMSGFDHIVCVSDATKRSVISCVGDSGNLITLYNPIDYKKILSKSKELCKVKKTTGSFLFVSAGRLSPPKNYDLLIDICGRLEKKYNFELWIVGDGEQRTQLEQKILTQKIRSVKLLGFCENPFPIMKQADCFVSSSTWESYGLAIQESFILGVPAIAARSPAIDEVFDKRFGILANGDFEGLYTAMETVLKNPALLFDFGAALREHYDCNSLYEDRLKAICNLWEKNNGKTS